MIRLANRAHSLENELMNEIPDPLKKTVKAWDSFVGPAGWMLYVATDEKMSKEKKDKITSHAIQHTDILEDIAEMHVPEALQSLLAANLSQPLKNMLEKILEEYTPTP